MFKKYFAVPKEPPQAIMGFSDTCTESPRLSAAVRVRQVCTAHGHACVRRLGDPQCGRALVGSMSSLPCTGTQARLLY